MTQPFKHPLRIEALHPAYEKETADLAAQLKLPVAENSELVLQFGGQGLVLQGQDTGPVRVDFLSGALSHRRKFGGGQSQMLAKAIGIQAAIRPDVLDATAGLGRDAFILAALGCQVTMIERHPVIAALLKDGMKRADNDQAHKGIMASMRLIQADAIELMQTWQEKPPQVIYLDPMFPARDKGALVKKEMRLFRLLAGSDEDAAALLEAALPLATHRVVVKRHRKSSAIAGLAPTYALQGQSSRFDIYARKSLQIKNPEAK